MFRPVNPGRSLSPEAAGGADGRAQPCPRRRTRFALDEQTSAVTASRVGEDREKQASVRPFRGRAHRLRPGRKAAGFRGPGGAHPGGRTRHLLSQEQTRRRLPRVRRQCVKPRAVSVALPDTEKNPKPSCSGVEGRRDQSSATRRGDGGPVTSHKELPRTSKDAAGNAVLTTLCRMVYGLFLAMPG